MPGFLVDPALQQSFALSVVSGLLVATLEIVIFSVILKRRLAKRDAERWMPFRRYLLQVLYNEALRSMEIGNGLFRDLDADLEGSDAKMLSPQTVSAMVARLERATQALSVVRTNVHQAIQTAAPSLTSEAAGHFTNIFRALDNGPLLGASLAQSLQALKPEQGAGASAGSHAWSEARGEVSAQAIKLLGGVSYLVRDVESLLEQEGYCVIEGVVSTPEDVERRRKTEAWVENVRSQGSQQRQ